MRDCNDSGEGCVEVDAVDTEIFWSAMDLEVVDDCKSLNNPSSFSSNLSVLVASGLLAILRVRNVVMGLQSLFNRRHLDCVSLTIHVE